MPEPNVVPIRVKSDLHAEGMHPSCMPMEKANNTDNGSAKVHPLNSSRNHSVGAQSARDDEWTILLIRVAQHRDKQAFGKLFLHFAPLLKGFVLSNAGLSSDADAEELVQEIMLKVWNRAELFNPRKASATTWIYTLARNSRIDLLRKKNRQNAVIDSDALWEIDAPVQPEHNSSEDPSSAIARSEISEALSNLPDEQQLVVSKVYIEGKSHTEVSSELSLPLGTVKSRIRLALSKLKLILDQ